MPIDLKQLTGVLNTDDNADVMPPFHHKYLMNGRFRGNGNNMRLESVPGNVLIPNYLLPAGTNQCIGVFFDQVKQRILFANYNSNGRNGWYQYNIKNKQLTKIFLCFTDSATDIFRFSRDYPIHSCAIIYRTETEGDLLYWTDNNEADQNHPRYLNLDTVASLAPFTEDMINAAKNAPGVPPEVEYLDDSNVTVNNLSKNLFQFAYAWGYKQALEQSTLSPWSKTALPDNGYDPDTQNDPTKNNNISVDVIGGGDDYDSIYIYGRECKGSVYSDPFLIEVLDRTQYSINPGATYTYLFYNNSVYTTADLKYVSLPFSYIPNYAETLESLNGNVIIYANTIDGYDRLTRSQVDVTITTNLSGPGIPSITFAPGGDSVLFLQIGSVITPGVTYHVQFNYSSGAPGDSSPKNVNYLTIGGDTQNSVVAALQALLSGNNITSDNLGSGLMKIYTTTGTGSISNTDISVDSSTTATASAAWKWSGRYRFGLVYFDARGKTNGVISFLSADADTTDFSVVTGNFDVIGLTNTIQIPVINASINHTPPTWAVTYQWVRTNNINTDKFLYWVTNDYQDPGDGYLYFCIQNLYYQNAQNTGFLPTYDFAPGDRMRWMARYDTPSNTYIPFNIQLDFEIVGVIQRTMDTPAIAGTFIKVVKPTTMPSGLINFQNFIELYTPSLRTPTDLQVFYEWGEEFAIYELAGQRYHRGQITDQTASQPATFEWFDGDVYFRNRKWYTTPTISNTETSFMMDANYSDYFASKVNSNGRTQVIDDSQKRIKNGVQLRWGQKYQQDTDINQLNIFYPEDADVVDLAKGDILRLKVRERILRLFQDRGVGQLGVYTKFIEDSNGSNILATTDVIITPNNVNYYDGEIGLGGQPTALVSSINADYIADCVRGVQARLAPDGFTEISTLYKGQYYIKSLLTPYNKDYLRSDGSRAKIMGYFDFFENQYGCILQGGTLSGNTIGNYNFSFNEPRNAYCSFYAWDNPDWAIGAEDLVYSWKNGQLYVHNNETQWCNFYNQQFYPSITLVFNDKVQIKKTFNAIAYQGNQYWVSDTTGDILTSQPNPQTNLPQISQLKSVDYDINEGLYYAALLRDANSMSNAQLALCEGDFLKGTWIQAKLTYKGSDFAYLYSPYLNWVESPRNF